MINSLKSEFRKLLTIRSTYVLLTIAVLLGSVLIGFWIFGYKDVDHATQNSSALMDMLLQAVSTASLFLSFAVILLVCHEYRYNTIMYNLTNTSRRSKFFLIKYLAVIIFSLLVAAVVMLLAWALFYLGLHLHNLTPVAQHVPLWNMLWQSAATVIGNISYAFIIAMLLRSLIGAIALFLVVPTTVENLLSLLLHDNTKYLPFTALGNLSSLGTKISYGFSLSVVLAYVVIGGLVAYVLFMKRDAN